MHKVTIYTTPSCVYCKMTKEFFAKNNIQYQEKNVATDMQAREEMLEKSQQLGVPVIDIDDETVVIGFDQKNLEKALGIGAAAK